VSEDRSIRGLEPRWEAVVAGAGPAGAMTACLLAGSGLRTLLVDKAGFPRDKACGGCLGAPGLGVLERHGLEDLPERQGGRRILRFDLWASGRRVTLPMERGVAISRRTLDAALTDGATQRGCVFLDRTSAVVGPCEGSHRRLTLRQAGGDREIRARIVVVADGLAGTALNEEPARRWRWIWRRSRIGLAAVVEAAEGLVEPGTIAMAVGRSGYLGMVRLEGDRVGLAAAVDPSRLREAPRPESALGSILSEAGLPVEPLAAVGRWSGTPRLTRRPARIAGERLFLLGDAAGYEEPFTGEGISWALLAAEALAPIARDASRCWSSAHAEGWAGEHRRLLGSRLRRCRVIAASLRHPLLVAGLARLLSTHPRLASPLIRRIQLSRPDSYPSKERIPCP
jgi:flavin-dependent dehydrogenase